MKSSESSLLAIFLGAVGVLLMITGWMVGGVTKEVVEREPIFGGWMVTTRHPYAMIGLMLIIVGAVLLIAAFLCAGLALDKYQAEKKRVLER